MATRAPEPGPRSGALAALPRVCDGHSRAEDLYCSYSRVRIFNEIKFPGLRSSCIVASSSTPSTRRLLDGVAMPVPHRSTEPGRPRMHPTHWLISTQVVWVV